jgi:hypothetical protein
LRSTSCGSWAEIAAEILGTLNPGPPSSIPVDETGPGFEVIVSEPFFLGGDPGEVMPLADGVGVILLIRLPIG